MIILSGSKQTLNSKHHGQFSTNSITAAQKSK